MFKIILIFAALLQFSFAGITINGQIKNAEGKAPKFADAHIVEFGGSTSKPLKSTHADKSGNFSLQVESGKYYMLYLTAVDHKALTVPLVTDEKEITVDVTIQLKANNYKKTFEDVKIIGDWNKFSFRSAEDMKKTDDGTFIYSLKSDAEKVAYQLIDVDNDGHSVNGNMNNLFEYDGGGDYKSIVKTVNGSATIVFDPAKVFRSNSKDVPKVVYKNNDELNQIAAIDKKANAGLDKYYSARRTYNSKHKSLDGFKFDFAPLAVYLEKQMNQDNKLIARYSATKYVKIINAKYKDADPKIAVELLSITDPLWSLNSNSLTNIYSEAYGKEKANKMIAESFNKIPSKSVQARILVKQGMEAKENDNLKLMANVYDKLVQGYPELKGELRWYLGELDPSKAIMKGKQVPDFDVQLIHSEERVSRESMLGKYYLIDFWAVWCSPCRVEMPNLHAVYKEFKSDKFEILSLSFDPKLTTVDKYRKGTWPMPWLHTFVEKGFENELSKRFEVIGIPKPILVNSEGIIIATGSELRGENLKKTLEKHLNKVM
ncbi:MAG: TlpA family protein disulfide reductase [Calditrichaeota bacterium]|nr:TlpA family protein disulfide reductase [Calditrichota bacterium]